MSLQCTGNDRNLITLIVPAAGNPKHISQMNNDPQALISISANVISHWSHYSDVTWASWCLKSPATQLFVQQYVAKDNIEDTFQAFCEWNPPVTKGFPS